MERTWRRANHGPIFQGPLASRLSRRSTRTASASGADVSPTISSTARASRNRPGRRANRSARCSVPQAGRKRPLSMGSMGRGFVYGRYSGRTSDLRLVEAEDISRSRSPPSGRNRPWGGRSRFKAFGAFTARGHPWAQMRHTMPPGRPRWAPITARRRAIRAAARLRDPEADQRRASFSASRRGARSGWTARRAARRGRDRARRRTSRGAPAA